MTKTNGSSYYSTPGPMADLTGCPPEMLADLPEDVDGLIDVVRGCVVDAGLTSEIHGAGGPAGRAGETQIRSVTQMVERIAMVDPAPLVRPRAPEHRFLGTCRHFALLGSALLIHKGVPARARAGFAGYFVADTWVDHWIVEWWRSGQGWVRVDPQLDDLWVGANAPDTTAESLVQSRYLSAAEAWRKCRLGELDPGRFRMGGQNWGIGEVRGSVILDLAALNKVEMLPWDSWGKMEAAYQGVTDASFDEFLDAVSESVMGGDVDAIRALYETSDDLRVPASAR